MKDSNKLFNYARLHFGNTRQPFSVTVLGEELYIVTSPSDISSVYKNTKALDFDPFIHNVAMAFGASKINADKMFEKMRNARGGSAEPDAKVSGNPKSFMEQSHENYKLQLHPGPKLEELQRVFLSRVDAYLQFDGLASRIIGSSSESQAKVVSLLDWTSGVLLDASTRAFFGDTLLDAVQPNLLDNFIVFDDESWKLNYQYPRIAAKAMYDAKDESVAAFESYLSLPHEKRPGATWIITTLESDMRALGMETQQISSMIFMIYWVVNANAYKLAFWMVAHIVFDHTLLEAVRDEISSCFTPSPGGPHTDQIASLSTLFEKTSLLSSIYHESLRVYNAPMGARTVTSPCSLPSAPDIILQPGRKLLMPYRQIHFDPIAWGKDINSFDAKRFLGPWGERLKSGNTSFRPFGGGSTHCPGRFLAWREVAVFVACLIWRFDIELAHAESEFPVLDERKPSGGMMGPVKGSKGEVILKIKSREISDA